MGVSSHLSKRISQDHRCPGSAASRDLSTCALIYAGQQLGAWSKGPKSLVTRLDCSPRLGFELRELAFALVAGHSADVMQARTLHDMDSVEDTAIVIADAGCGGGRRLPTTVVAALITA